MFADIAQFISWPISLIHSLRLALHYASLFIRTFITSFLRIIKALAVKQQAAQRSYN